jgi:hypothetical protein
MQQVTSPIQEIRILDGETSFCRSHLQRASLQLRIAAGLTNLVRVLIRAHVDDVLDTDFSARPAVGIASITMLSPTSSVPIPPL